MTSFPRSINLLAWAGSILLLSSPAMAAQATNGPAVPPVPRLRSPVETFRELLAMDPVERRRSLTNRPLEIQKRIQAKLREYESLDPRERELRLRATELQWYLQPLMSGPRAGRAERLALVPEEWRQVVEERLKRWDMLPPPLQEQLLNDEMTARYFTQLQGETNRALILARISPERRAKLEAGLDRWQGLTEEQRRKTLAGFNAFFELTPREKERTLNAFPEWEQRQMERTLEAYEKLPLPVRLQCMRSFEKFTGMPLEERQLFLKNAERWKLMSPAERESWRRLVTSAPLQPVLPPLPPLPPPRQPRTAMMTDG